ncbi:MAG: hypothetical protein MUF54_22625 [Polyangiaceae bacterium]|nr:hypothetical protein [Polyangiaceae bacterium]
MMRILSKEGAIWLLATASAAVAAPGMAQDSAASEALFDKGVAEMEAGGYATACPALAESYRLDPRPGTMFTLAECEAKWGRVASAVAHYSDYVGMVSSMPPQSRERHLDRERTAVAQLETLKPQVPRLTLILPADAPEGTVVKRDGVVLRGASLGTPLPADPGEHMVTTQVPGGVEHAKQINIALGETARIELSVERLEAVRTQASTNPASPSTEPARSSDARTWAYVLGGIGVAGLAVGTVTGLMAGAKKGTVDDNCKGAACNAQGLAAAEDGKMLGNVSTAGFGVGLAGIAIGSVLWFASAPSSPEASAGSRWSPPVVAGGRRVAVGVQGSW